MLSHQTIEYANDLAGALLGLDRLHRRAFPEDRWGIVVLNLEPQLRVEDFANGAAASARFQTLLAAAGRLPEPDRRSYYRDLCRSALTIVSLQEGSVTLEQQVAGFLAAQPRPASAVEIDGLREEIAGRLDTLGYSGSLEERCAAWQATHHVTAEDIGRVMSDQIAEARERTEALFGPIRGSSPTVTTLSGAPFNARCDYVGGTVEINSDPVLTRPELKHLTLHEVYPGHCLQFEQRERAYEDGAGGADGLLSLVKSAGSPLFEGIADSGGALLGWEDEDDRLCALLVRYRAGLGTVAAWGIHAQGWSLREAADYLTRRTLTGGQGWVANRLAYIGPENRGAHVWSYWLGEQRLRPLISEHGKDPAWRRFLYGRMHSLESVGLYAATPEGTGKHQ